jgi:Pentatricopeptide repeat domain
MHTQLSTEPESDSDPSAQAPLALTDISERSRTQLNVLKMDIETKRDGPIVYVTDPTTSYSRFKRRLYVLRRYRSRMTHEGRGYAAPNSIPRRVLRVTERSLGLLQRQGRAISKESFKTHVKLALSSMYSSHGVPRWWVDYFQDLFAKTKEGNMDNWEMPPRVDDFTSSLIDTIEDQGIEGFKAVWDGLGIRVKTAQWPLIALHLLRNSAAKIPEFLLTTYREPYPPFGMISDCMIYLVYFHPEIDRAVKRNVLLVCMDPERWPIISVPQRGVRLYVKFAGLKNAYRAFEIMRERESLVSAHTILGFMNVFINACDVDRALECLRMIPVINSDQLSMNSEGVLRHCCRLLLLDRVVDEDGSRNFKILPQILELGVKPCLEMMNIVLSNAFATGDTHLGLDMLKYMKDQGMVFSSYTYMALLKDAVARVDSDGVESLLHDINSRSDFKNNKFIASKVFHAHFTFNVKNYNRSANPAGAFLDMLDLYARYYDLTPLRDLKIIPEQYNSMEINQDIQPSAPVLFIMLATYLRCSRKPAHSLQIYREFCQRVAERHPLIAPLVQYPQIFNEFILSFRHAYPDLSDCVSIVDDMIHPSSESFIIDDELVEPAKPNVWTWTTLMSVFVCHGDQNAVQSIRQMMEKNGIEFNIVTWNTIIFGAVTSDDASGAALAMKEMDKHGFTPDKYTQQALRFLKEPELFQAAIQKLDEEAENILRLENEALDREDDELLDKGLKRLAITSKA